MNKRILSFYLALILIVNAHAQWQNMGPLTGNVRCFYKGTSATYCGLNKLPYGLFKSTDSGKTWHSMNGPIAAVTSIIEFKDILFATDNTGTRVYRSHKDSNKWEYGFCNGAAKIHDLCQVEDTLFAGTNEGIYKSTDLGKTWVNVKISGNYTSLVYAFKKIFASSNSAIDVSVDFGKTWSPAFLQSGRNLFTDNRFIFGSLNASPIGVLVSTDSGKTWNNYTAGLPASTFPLAFTKSNNTYFLLARDVTYKSSDTGKSWTECGKAGFTYNGGDLLATDNLLYTCYPSDDFNGGIYTSADLGKTWKHVGLPIYSVEAMGAHNDTIFIAKNQTGISSDRGKTWTLGDYGPADPFQFKFFNNKMFLLGKTNVSVSTNRGANYSTFINLPIIEFEHLGNKYFANTTSQTYTTNLNGGGITSIPKLSNMYLGKIIVYGGNIFISSRSHLDSSFYSTDTGKTWKKHQDTLFLALSAAHTMGNTIYAGIWEEGNIYSLIKSTNGGFNWEKLKNNLPNATIDCIISKNNILYVASYKGLFASMDGGNTFMDANAGFNNNPYPISYIAMDDSFFYVTGFFGGVWRGNPILTAEVKPINKKNELKLSVYPNPVNDKLIVNNLPKLTGNLKVEIYDIKGNKVFVKNYNTYSILNNFIEIPIENINNGLYSISVCTENSRASYKIVINHQ